MGPIALFVVLVVMPVAALVLVAAALVITALVAVAVAVPVISWVSFGGGLGLGGVVWWVRSRHSRVSGVT